jgi:hypothetical protein
LLDERVQLSQRWEEAFLFDIRPRTFTILNAVFFENCLNGIDLAPLKANIQLPSQSLATDS